MTTIILNNQWISFKSEYELVNIAINESKVDLLIEKKLRRRGVSFIRIGNKQYSSYLKASKQYDSGRLPPVINACHTNRIFLQSVTIDILYSICWNECINNMK